MSVLPRRNRKGENKKKAKRTSRLGTALVLPCGMEARTRWAQTGRRRRRCNRGIACRDTLVWRWCGGTRFHKQQHTTFEPFSRENVRSFWERTKNHSDLRGAQARTEGEERELGFGEGRCEGCVLVYVVSPSLYIIGSHRGPKCSSTVRSINPSSRAGRQAGLLWWTFRIPLLWPPSQHTAQGYRLASVLSRARRDRESL